jgi:hypothetical protein
MPISRPPYILTHITYLFNYHDFIPLCIDGVANDMYLYRATGQWGQDPSMFQVCGSCLSKFSRKSALMDVTIAMPQTTQNICTSIFRMGFKPTVPVINLFVTDCTEYMLVKYFRWILDGMGDRFTIRPRIRFQYYLNHLPMEVYQRCRYCQ